MFERRLQTLALVLAVLPFGGAALAQDRAQSLADIRQELSILNSAVAGLRAELQSSGNPGMAMPAGNFLARIDTIEAALAQLTAKTEALEFRINQVVNDGTNRLGDIDFRLTELEGGDLSQAGQVQPLGGQASTSAPAPAPAPSATQSTGPSMAVNEKADFDRAREVLGQGDFRTAATLFETYAQTYPGGPLIPEALFLRGNALEQAGDVPGAARSWLDAFSAEIDGPHAPEALFKLGQALSQLGQGPDACITLAEVSLRYPTSPFAGQAQAAVQSLGCS